MGSSSPTETLIAEKYCDDELLNRRREILKDTIRKAAKELLGFGNIPIAGFIFPLDDSKTTWIIVRPATEDEADAELTKGRPKPSHPGR